MHKYVNEGWLYFLFNLLLLKMFSIPTILSRRHHDTQFDCIQIFTAPTIKPRFQIDYFPSKCCDLAIFTLAYQTQSNAQ